MGCSPWGHKSQTRLRDETTTTTTAVLYLGVPLVLGETGPRENGVDLAECIPVCKVLSPA